MHKTLDKKGVTRFADKLSDFDTYRSNKLSAKISKLMETDELNLENTPLNSQW